VPGQSGLTLPVRLGPSCARCRLNKCVQRLGVWARRTGLCTKPRDHPLWACNSDSGVYNSDSNAAYNSNPSACNNDANAASSVYSNQHNY
jgi:hypothetical protein